jgi:7-cyano-7-deazaguanine reductase
MNHEDKGMLLGRQTPVLEQYTPDILRAIPRIEGRQLLALADALPFHGVDLWHAYELSWLDRAGKPVVRVGRFEVPADSPCMIESKSFKLYLNSLSNSRYGNEEELRQTIIADTSAVAGAPVALELLPLDHPLLAGAMPEGDCLDDIEFEPRQGEPGGDQLDVQPGNTVEERVFSHLLRSLCPVTGQPDWATLWLHYRGQRIERSARLQYLVGYRDHREFHEQCVERIFTDILNRCHPEVLHVQAFYTRRGGLDINPFRSTDPAARPLPRLARQ